MYSLNRLFRLLPGLVILSMALSLLTPQVAYAQGEQPPETPAVVEEDSGASSSGEEQSTPEAPGSGEEVSTEEPAVEETPVAPEETPAPSPEVPQSEPVLAETVEALAESEAVLVGADGQPIPLATQEAAEVLLAPDPYYSCSNDTVDGTADGTCHYSSIQVAINDFTVRGGSGNITIESGTFNENVVVNGIANLTGLVGSGSGAGGTLINGNVSIQNMTIANFLLGSFQVQGGGITINNTSSNVTLNDIDVNGYAAGTGVNVVNTTGSVNLTNVRSHNNDRSAWIDNSAGSGTVTFVGGSFNDNARSLYIKSKGNILVDGIQSNNSTLGIGLWLDNVGAAGATTTTIQNSTFTGNKQYGISATSTGAFTLSNITATGNSGGVALNNVGGSGAISVSGATLTNNGTPGSGEGLSISSTSAVTVSSITATGNGRSGASINTSTGTAGNVTVQNSVFSASGTPQMYGLQVTSSGQVTLDTVTASGNAQWGIWVDNTSSTAGASVNVSGGGASGNLASYGLRVLSKGAVDLNNFSATTNKLQGALITNTAGTGGVTISGTYSNNQATGVQVTSAGAVHVIGAVAQGNTGSGILIDNNASAASAGVTVDTGANASGNTAGQGLSISSKGVITLSDFTASNNSQSGALLVNTTGTAGVTVSGSNTFNTNGNMGLEVRSTGTVNVSGVNASGNQRGIAIDDTGAASTVTIANSTVTGANLSSVYVGSLGQIILNNVTSNNSITGHGFWLMNNTGTGGLTVTGGGASGNAKDGLNIVTNGAISVSSFTANGNLANGASLLNNAGTSGVTVTNSSFTSNVLGLNISSGAGVNLTGVTAAANQRGILINAKGGGTLDTVSATGNTVSSGLMLNSTVAGAWAITNSTFASNTTDGLQVNVAGSAAIHNNVFSGNTGAGLAVNAGQVLAYTNQIVGNGTGILVSGAAAGSAAYLNRIVGNTTGVNQTGGTLDAKDNWWGCNTGPGGAGCDTAVGNSPASYLVLELTPNPTVINLATGTSSTLTANVRKNNLGVSTETLYGAYLLDGPSVAFTSTIGTLGGSPVALTSGQAATSLTYNGVDGTSTLTAKLDNATVTQTMLIDRTRPVGTITGAPTDPTNQTLAGFTFTASDPGTGLQSVQCQVDGGVWASCSSPQNFPLGEGAHTFGLQLTDNAGNVNSPIPTSNWIVDLTRPTTDAGLAGVRYRGSMYVASVDVTLNADDPLSGGVKSGVGTTMYSLDGGPMQAYTGSLHVAAYGNHTVSFYSTDLAGNQELLQSTSFTVLNPEDLIKEPSIEGESDKTDAVGGAAFGGNDVQLVDVFLSAGSGPLSLELDRMIVFRMWEKEPVDAEGNRELARVSLPAYSVPQGSSLSFIPANVDALPDGAPGTVLAAAAFALNAVDESGNAASNLNGTANVRFLLPEGFSVPEGKQLAILYYDGTQWQTLETEAADGYVYANSSHFGTFALALIDK